MIGIALQQFARSSCVAFARRRWFRFFARLPDRRGALDPYYVGHLQLSQLYTETSVGPVAGVGQNHALRDAPLTRPSNLVESDFRLGLKLNRIRYSRLLPPLAVFDPRLRQVQAVRHRHTGFFRGHRKADRHTAVILFPDLPAILPGDSYRLMPLLGKSGVIYYPCHHWVTPQHGWDHKIQTAIQHWFVTPWGIGNHMMQRLMHPSYVVCTESGGHRFNAFAFARQQQTRTVILQRNVAIGMPCGFCQALNICRKALFLWAWRNPFTHRSILH